MNSNEMSQKMYSLCEQTKNAGKVIAQLDESRRNKILSDLSELLVKNKEKIIQENKKDIELAVDAGLSDAMIDRLTVTDNTILQIQKALETVVSLPDPLNQSYESNQQESGIYVTKKRIPLGVILMIYESRPNVTIEAASLAIKSGNAIVLRGGKEAFHSNQIFAECWKEALSKNNLPDSAVQVVPFTERELLKEMLKWDDVIDVVIPRGGEGLIKHVVAESYIPVIKHYKGVCHLYIDEFADLDKALPILLNGKVQRPGVCNALEGLIVHHAVAEKFLPKAVSELEKNGVKIYGCKESQKLVSSISQATEKEFAEEFLSLEISVKIVDSINEAIEFIDTYGSYHTEVIVTEDKQNAEKFINEVDASVVMHNASSRFSDGGELGLGAEIGISTTKIHAYGPMGLESLTSEKFVVIGDGEVRT